MTHYNAFWGKARPTHIDGPQSHPNAYHCLDVAAAAEVLLREGVSRPPASWSSTDDVSAVVALVALHDIGKFSRPFQAKAPEHWPAHLGPISGRVDPGHGAVGLSLLNGPLADLVLSMFPSWDPSERALLFAAVCGHHGRPVQALDFLSEDIVCAQCRNAAHAFAEAALEVLRPTALPVLQDDLDPALAWWLAGLTVLADWIGSSETWFAYQTPEYDLARYWHEVARPNAARAVAEAGLSPQKASTSLTLAELVGGEASPSPVQALAASLNLGAAGPLVVLVEDQTGSGKTEAALLLAHRLMTAGRADGMFVALPTMATANAMYERLAAAYRRLFAPEAHPSLVLAHGRRADHAGFQSSILHGAPVEGEPEDPDSETASAQCAAWLADDRRRVFMAHVGVGTIDQALLAVLPSRHAPLRLHGLHRRVLIVDEAHAYDAYMNEELQKLILFQAGLGGSTIVLSATLPSIVRKKLVHAYAAGAAVPPSTLRNQAYPLVTVLCRDGAEELPCPGRQGLARDVAVERLVTLDQALARVAEAARAGAAVAWVRNAVDDAGEAYAALASMGVPATLFHARFAMGDRQAIETAVLNQFGKLSSDRAGVVVATQVIEQSLDIDFDLMVTDLAPLDLLIQRAGRVWRHARDNRPFNGPRLLVLSPEPVDAPQTDWLGPALRRTGRVYEDHALLWRSARVLFAAGAITAPTDVRRLVETAYAPDGPVPLGLQSRASAAEGKASAARSLGRQNLLPWRDGYRLDTGAWASDVRTPTRLGEASTVIRLARWSDGVLRPWYQDAGPARAWSLSELSLAPWVATGVPTPSGALALAVDAARQGWDAWAREIPIFALSPEGKFWNGALEHGERVVTATYSSLKGLQT